MFSNETLIALIGALGVISGALITSFLYVISAKYKIKELELSSQQNQQKNMIESARNHLDDLYLPFYKKKSSLHYQYSIYRNILSGNKTKSIKPKISVAKNNLLDIIDEFLSDSKEIIQSGTTAYLIGNIEELLIEFVYFLENSINVKDDVIEEKYIQSFKFSILGVSYLKEKEFTKFKENKVLKDNEKIKSLNALNSLLNFLNRITKPYFSTSINLRYLRAPLSSNEFELQFLKYVMEIKKQIKQVTLWIKS